MDRRFPKVGVAAFVVKGDKVLLNRRSGSHGNGTWSIGGGHLEFGEEPEDCARREIMEEMGINVKNLKFIGVTNDIFKNEGKHYVTIFYKCEFASGRLKTPDREFSKRWKWVTWREARKKRLFLPINNLIDMGIDPTK